MRRRTRVAKPESRGKRARPGDPVPLLRAGPVLVFLLALAPPAASAGGPPAVFCPSDPACVDADGDDLCVSSSALSTCLDRVMRVYRDALNGCFDESCVVHEVRGSDHLFARCFGNEFVVVEEEYEASVAVVRAGDPREGEEPTTTKLAWAGFENGCAAGDGWYASWLNAGVWTQETGGVGVFWSATDTGDPETSWCHARIGIDVSCEDVGRPPYLGAPGCLDPPFPWIGAC